MSLTDIKLLFMMHQMVLMHGQKFLALQHSQLLVTNLLECSIIMKNAGKSNAFDINIAEPYDSSNTK